MPFDQIKAALRDAPKVKCENVSIREAESLRPGDDYDVWRDACGHGGSVYSRRFAGPIGIEAGSG